MSFINSADSRFSNIKPIPEIDNIEILKNGMLTKWNNSDVELCGSCIALSKNVDTYKANIFPQSMFGTYEGFFENTKEVLNTNTISFNYSYASPTFRITNESYTQTSTNDDVKWNMQIDRAVAFIKALGENIGKDTIIHKISWQKYVMYRPRIIMHFTDKKIHELKKSDYTKYKNSLTTENFFVKNANIPNTNDLTFNNVQGCAFLYEIYSDTANFSNIICYVQSINQSAGAGGTSIYDGPTSLDNIKNLPEFQRISEWSDDGTMYIIIKNTDTSTKEQIPFKLCKVQKATKTNDDGQSEIYPEILEEYNMYYISQEYTSSNTMYPYRRCVMCDINISSTIQHIGDLKKRTYTTSNINLMYCSDTINYFSQLTTYTKDDKKMNYKYTYFFIAPIENTFDFVEYLQIEDNEHNTYEFSGINVERTLEMYNNTINQVLFSANKEQFRANEQFENYTYEISEGSIHFRITSPLQFTSTWEWKNVYDSDEITVVGDATSAEKNKEVIVDGSNFMKPVSKPVCYLQNVNVSGSYINITKFNESYRSNSKLHYKKNGDPCKTKETSIRKFITTTRPDIIYCFGDGNQHGLFGNNNYVSYDYVDDEGNTKTKMLGLSRRAHNRRLISNRDVGILKGNMQLIKFIHDGKVIDNYHKYINDYLKTHDNKITNYDIVDIHLFKRDSKQIDDKIINDYVTSFDYSRYFTDYLRVNIKKSYQYIMEYKTSSEHSSEKYNEMIHKLHYFDHTIYSNLLGDNEFDKKIKKRLYAHQPLLVLLWNNSYKFAIDNLLMGIVAKNIYVTTAQVLKYTGLVFTENEMKKINQTMCSILYEHVIKLSGVFKQKGILHSVNNIEHECVRGWFRHNFNTSHNVSDVIIDAYGLTDQQKIILKHNLLQLYVIKGYGNTEYDKIFNNDFTDITYRMPKFKQVTYRNYSKNADSEEPKKNIRKRIKFIVSEDNITKSQLFVDGVTSQD